MFCGKCGNIMTLKKREGNLGIFVCRNCSFTKRVKFNPIEIKESVNYIAPPVPVFHY